MSQTKDNTLGIILAHGKVCETVLRHIPVWELNCDRMFFFTPVDDTLPLPVHQYSVGKSGAYCADTNTRCREALRFASLTQYDYVMLAEYDSLIFKPIPSGVVIDSGVTAPKFLEPNHGRKFLGKFYLHFPQIYSKAAVRNVVREMDRLPSNAEHGFTDRYVGLAVEKTFEVVENLNNTPHAYTQNHIDRARLPEAIEAYRKGAFWSHGIKDSFVFATLQAEAV